MPKLHGVKYEVKRTAHEGLCYAIVDDVGHPRRIISKVRAKLSAQPHIVAVHLVKRRWGNLPIGEAVRRHLVDQADSKECRTCGRELPRDAYARREKGSDKRLPDCKECRQSQRKQGR